MLIQKHVRYTVDKASVRREVLVGFLFEMFGSEAVRLMYEIDTKGAITLEVKEKCPITSATTPTLVG